MQNLSILSSCNICLKMFMTIVIVMCLIMIVHFSLSSFYYNHCQIQRSNHIPIEPLSPSLKAEQVLQSMSSHQIRIGASFSQSQVSLSSLQSIPSLPIVASAWSSSDGSQRKRNCNPFNLDIQWYKLWCSSKPSNCSIFDLARRGVLTPIALERRR